MTIAINIHAGRDTKDSHVTGAGNTSHVITDTERATFGIEDAALKAAVGEIMGKVPDQAYIRAPTDGNNLYTSYPYPQVTTNLAVQSTEILGTTQEPQIVATQRFVNDTNREDGKFGVSIQQAVEDTASSTWSKSNTIDVSQEISYSIGFVGGKTSFSYSHSWGSSKTESRSVNLQQGSDVTVDLKPHESVEAELSATRGTMQVRVVYQAHLTGYTWLNYGKRYNGHYFYAVPIGDAMQTAGVPNIATITEDISVGFYTDGKTVIRNLKGQVILQRRLDHIAA